ncbi:dromyosuppressin isoform X1 [Anopheles arabiensis]|uniref:dromyosuppressin isoform X1 n=1 Tax=Anopheles arabiensis TaxID=7173 RepID=UPI001AAD3930|nr:dromyosuppressin isoform X1 [Anopheles arabiensis]XP_040228337.1 dromyosuppressin isoform X1 [Anopheles coluzzii]XP_041763690.1 dromyosuppressin isoform X1 [Anopheles merus]XP_061503802.1 dromyosuppressin isoform X1 [Anopheles gambiae]
MASQQIASLKAVTCVVLLLVIVCSLVAGSAMPPLCENRLIDELPPKFRKVCAALENSNQFAEALNAYIRKEAAGNAFLYLDDDMLVPGQTGKRTDVDHVFLRFGRRR